MYLPNPFSRAVSRQDFATNNQSVGVPLDDKLTSVGKSAGEAS